MRRDSERGAVLVYVAMAIVALLAVSALTIDAGAKWVARGQAQNAADAGALAGAVALSFDDPDDFTDSGLAKLNAQNYAVANLVWGEAPDVRISSDVTFPPCPDGSADLCVKVDVYRNQLRGNPLPTFFARIVGVVNQGVVATATARVRTGNATDCLKPWAVVDRWDEFDGPEPDYPGSDADWTLGSTFDRYDERSPEADLYVAPTPTSSGTGWTLARDFGRQFGLKTDAPGNSTVSSGWFRALDLPRLETSGTGGATYGDNIRTCNGYPVGIAAPETVCPTGSDISTIQEKVDWAARGCVRVQTGVIQGQTIDGVREIFARDPVARWNPSMHGGLGGVANSCCAPSPRIVPISAMDIDQYLAADPSGSGTSVRIVNIFGFFIEGMGDVDADGNIIFDPANPMDARNHVVVGRIMTLPGLYIAGTGSANPNSAFLRTILLVR